MNLVVAGHLNTVQVQDLLKKFGRISEPIRGTLLNPLPQPTKSDKAKPPRFGGFGRNCNYVIFSIWTFMNG